MKRVCIGRGVLKRLVNTSFKLGSCTIVRRRVKTVMFITNSEIEKVEIEVKGVEVENEKGKQSKANSQFKPRSPLPF